MHALKEGVSEKLSMLFSDSPSQNPDQSPKARECNKERKSWTSMLTLLLQPVSLAKVTHSNQNADVTSLRSDSFTWRSKSFSLKDKPLDRPPTEQGQDSEGSSPTEEYYCDPGTGRSNASDFDVFEDATDPFSLVKSMPNLIDESLFISPELYEFFESCLPNIVKGCQWTLLYSTVKDGISLRTLIRNSNNISGPCLLIAGDKQGAVFGGLLDCPLNPTAKRKYQGTNQTFIFTTIFGEPRLFRPTGANRYFYLCLNDMLALGGGSNFALSLDGDLLTGTSGPSETFGNVCLAHDQEFELKNVELWGFTHASQYLPYQNGV